MSFAKTGAPLEHTDKESYLVIWVNIYTKNNVNAFCECCRRFQMSESSSCFGCQANISSDLIFQTSLSWAGMECSFDVSYITSMRCIEFSKHSPDINPSVAKENMITLKVPALHCTCVQFRYC